MVFFASQSRRDDPALERVLVVDDDPNVLAMESRVLKDAGFQVIPASDGLEALNKVLEQPKAFNAVVSDVVMPNMDGIGLRDRLARVRPSLPVVLLSAYNPTDLRSRGIEAPCAFLSKPVSPDTLVAAVRDCIAGSSHTG